MEISLLSALMPDLFILNFCETASDIITSAICNICYSFSSWCAFSVVTGSRKDRARQERKMCLGGCVVAKGCKALPFLRVSVSKARVTYSQRANRWLRPIFGLLSSGYDVSCESHAFCRVNPFPLNCPSLFVVISKPCRLYFLQWLLFIDIFPFLFCAAFYMKYNSTWCLMIDLMGEKDKKWKHKWTISAVLHNLIYPLHLHHIDQNLKQ